MEQYGEEAYQAQVDNILKNGNVRIVRTGISAKSVFGITMRFSLENNSFPLLTTKRMFTRGIVEELLWMISGSTDSKILSNKGIHIWDGNASRSFLDGRGLHHRREGDLGPIYGFQWRHSGAKYIDCDTDYTGQGVDQLKNCIELIKKDPTSRRIVMSAWNPSDIDSMALPPCHMFCQFYVEGNKLSCLMFQRSADMGLGVPFNIASYALLTRIVAQCTGLVAHEFIHQIGDAHIYENHILPLEEQLKRGPLSPPTLRIDSDNTDIDRFTADMFVIEDYRSHNAIKMEMTI